MFQTECSWRTVTFIFLCQVLFWRDICKELIHPSVLSLCVLVQRLSKLQPIHSLWILGVLCCGTGKSISFNIRHNFACAQASTQYTVSIVALVFTYTESKWKQGYTNTHSKSACVSANPCCKPRVSGGLFLLSATMFHHSTHVCALVYFVYRKCVEVCSFFCEWCLHGCVWTLYEGRFLYCTLLPPQQRLSLWWSGSLNQRLIFSLLLMLLPNVYNSKTGLKSLVWQHFEQPVWSVMLSATVKAAVSTQLM